MWFSIISKRYAVYILQPHVRLLYNNSRIRTQYLQYIYIFLILLVVTPLFPKYCSIVSMLYTTITEG